MYYVNYGSDIGAVELNVFYLSRSASISNWRFNQLEVFFYVYLSFGEM